MAVCLTDKKKVERWLDEQIRLMFRLHKIRSFSWGGFDEEKGKNEYEAVNTFDILHMYMDPTGEYREVRSIHMYHVGDLAKLLEIPLQRRDRNDTSYPYEYYFKYRGWIIFSIETEDCYG